MKKLILISMLLLVGCKEPTPQKVFVSSSCPTFKAKLKIDVIRYDDDYALISWKDVNSIEHFLKQKKVFNTEVNKINKAK